MMKWNRITQLVFVVSVLVLNTACERAVGVHHPAAFVINGDHASEIYPLEVKEQSEDVIIQMKPGAPTPLIIFIDAKGEESRYNFKMEGDQIVIPDKFSRLSLRHAGDSNVEILRKTN
jgi:hypothetical protein